MVYKTTEVKNMKKIFIMIMITSTSMHTCLPVKSGKIPLLSKIYKIVNPNETKLTTVKEIFEAQTNNPLFYNIQRKNFTYYINQECKENYIPLLKRQNTQQYEPIAPYLIAVYYAALFKSMIDKLKPSIELREAPGNGAGIYQFFKKDRAITPIFNENMFNSEKDTTIKNFLQLLALVGPCGRFATNEDESQIIISGKQAMYTCTTNPFQIKYVTGFHSLVATNDLQKNYFGSVSMDSNDNIRIIFNPEKDYFVSLETEINNDI